jgi:hypothetical protein
MNTANGGWRAILEASKTAARAVPAFERTMTRAVEAGAVPQTTNA